MKLITSKIETQKVPLRVVRWKVNSDGVSPEPQCRCFYLYSACVSFSAVITRQNNVEELYSLIKFLRIRPLNEWHTFNEQIAKPVKGGRPGRALKRLHVRSQFTIAVLPLTGHPCAIGCPEINHASTHQESNPEWQAASSATRTYPQPGRMFFQCH